MATGRVVLVTLEEVREGDQIIPWAAPGAYKDLINAGSHWQEPRKLWWPCTRQGLEWWGDLHPWRFFNSTGQGTDQLALALQLVLLGAGGWGGDLQNSHATKILQYFFVWLKDQAAHCCCQPQSPFCPTWGTQICSLQALCCKNHTSNGFPLDFTKKATSSFTSLMSTGFLQRMHRKTALSAHSGTPRAVAYCLREYSKPFFVKLFLKGGLPTSMPRVPCLQSHLLRCLRPQNTMEEEFQMCFCLGRNGCKGWKDGRAPGWFNKHVGGRSREGHWKCWVTWGTQIAECAFFPETVTGQMSHPSWEALQYNKVSCLVLH